MRHPRDSKSKVRCLRLVRFADIELRNAIGLALDDPSSIDFFDCLSYFKKEDTPFTGRAQGVDLRGNVMAEGFFVEGRPEAAGRAGMTMAASAKSFALPTANAAMFATGMKMAPQSKGN